MGKIFRLLRKAYIRLRLHAASPRTRPSIYSRHYGIEFGNNVRITGMISIGSEPYLVKVGDNVTITEGVVFHTHDGGTWVLREKHPGLNIFRPVAIGNNVFIGYRAQIMPGVRVGDNVVIAAGSVVTRDIPGNSVAAGVPAEVIKPLESYERKALEEGICLQETDPVRRKISILESLEKVD